MNETKIELIRRSKEDLESLMNASLLIWGQATAVGDREKSKRYEDEIRRMDAEYFQVTGTNYIFTN